MSSPDETGWKVAGGLATAVGLCDPDDDGLSHSTRPRLRRGGRGVRGDFAGVLVRNGWAPYRQFMAAMHQTCPAHLVRRCRLVTADHPHRSFGADVQAILQQALEVRDRYQA